MLEYLDAQISSNALIWLFLAAFMIHDLEEIIYMEGWMKKHGNLLGRKMPGWFSQLMGWYGKITGARFAVPVAFEFIAFIPITFYAAERQHYAFFLGINAIMFIHVFTHIGNSLRVGRYTPGVVTAVLVALPYTAYLFYRLTGDGLIVWTEVWDSIPYGAVLVPIVGLGYLASKYMVPVPER